MAIDEAAAQLEAELRSSVAEALDAHRPLLHHLNADSSWLLQIPRPEAETTKGERHYFNILLDPWLSGGQSDVAKWFSQQFHATESKCPTISVVEEVISEIEKTIAELKAEKTKSRGRLWKPRANLDKEASLIDAVAISHEFTDHCHKETLLEVPCSVPVFATEKAADLISSWKQFDLVQKTPNFGGDNVDWKSTSLFPLPSWLAINRIITKGDALYYHSALLIAFDNGHSDTAEGVIYTPHGIHAEDLEIMPKASPPIKTLAFLHGLHDISIANQQQLNLGAHNGLQAQRILHAKYWIGTHDEVKTGGGLVSWFLRRKVISLQDALEEERKKGRGVDGAAADASDTGDLANANWLELGNGESRVLV